MSFLNPFFWLGLAALAAPVLVHLVRRTRARKVEFPALVFVRQVPQRTIRRRTLHNLLLLILRCLAILLVVVAFTRPFFGGGSTEASGGKTPASVILIDASLSMRGGEHFPLALRRAEEIIGAASGEELLALMSFGERYTIASRFTADKSKVRAALAGLDAGYEGTDYEQALRGAESLFTELKSGGPRRIFLISDFQAVGHGRSGSGFRLADDVRLSLVDVAPDASANVAVTNVEARAVVYGQKYADKLAVHLSNFGDEARERVAVDFRINDQTVEKREVSIGANDSRVVEFTGFNLAEGANRCAIVVVSDDFAPDNQFYFTLRRETAAKALIVDRAARGRGDSFYLQSALTTGETLPFTFEVKSPGGVDPSGLSAYSLVILNDAGSLPGPLSESLNGFVETGGRLIIAAGPNTDPGSFNQALGRVSPATLGEAAALERGETVALTDVKMDHPVFEVFRGGGRLASARVFGYRRSEPRENASVLARFEDGSPALVESPIGAGGRVLLFTSTLGTGWTDLPLTPVYLPLVQQMARYLGEREAAAWHRLGQTFTVTKTPEGAPPAVDTPAGARLAENRLTPDGDLLVTGREPGFYRLRYQGGPDFAAVNVDGYEGDFTKLDRDEFLAAVTGGARPAEVSAADARLSDEETEARQRVWWPLLLAALLLFAAEALIARRTRVVKMIG